MEIYITEISKYVICLLGIFYTFAAFLSLAVKSEERRNGICTFQFAQLLGIQFLCFLQIEARTGKINYLFYYAFQLVILVAFLLLFRVIYGESHRLVLNNMCFMLMIGMIIILRIDEAKAVKQLVIAAVSLTISFFVPVAILKWKFLKKLTWIYAIIGAAALGIVYILGSVTNGSKISYTIAGLTFQPSEFVKILFVFFLAAALAQSHDFIQVLIAGIFAAIHVLILVASRDLGSAVIFFVVYVLTVFVATGNPLYLVLGTVLGGGGAYGAYRIFTHVQVRVQAWRDPWSTIDSTGYQITQSLFGISSGGWFGLGIFGGNPSAIPYVEDDFIFSAIAEEMGILFASCLVLVCVSTFLACMQEAFRTRDVFYRLLSFGIGTTYLFQVFLTVGGGTKFIPLTGVTLPLVSYGGTSVMATILMLSVFQGNCILRKRAWMQRMRRREEEAERDYQDNEDYE